MPAGFAVPIPSDDTTLRDDEDPLDPGDLDLALAPAAEAAAEQGGEAVAAAAEAAPETSREPRGSNDPE